MNIVGTPCSAVQRSSATACSVASGSKDFAREDHARAAVTQASTASTMPKQWYSGTGMHSESASLKFIARAMKCALLSTLWCVSVAPFGLPVVPLVNWMLIASRQSSLCADRVQPAASGRLARPRSSSAS